MFVFGAAQPAGSVKRLKAHPVRRILGRIGSQLSMSGASGDESDAIQVPVLSGG